MSKTGRGVLYQVWAGYEPRVRAALARSLDSLKQWHPELPVEIAELPEGSTLLEKARMAEITPFAETLFLDADTLVLGRLDYGFEKAQRHGLALSICECPWARRYPCCSGDMTEFNAGVMFFTEQAAPLLNRWHALGQEIDSSILFRRGEEVCRMPWNDQAGLTLAIEESGFNPWVLPMQWNYRPIWHRSWFGPVKVWHDYSDPSEAFLDFNAAQQETGALIDYAEASR